MLKIALGLHNLSTVPDKIKRTGIQEVVFQVLKASLDFSSDEVELFPTFFLPYTNCSSVDGYRATHINLWPKVLEDSLNEAGCSVDQFLKKWPYASQFFAKHTSHSTMDRCFLNTVANCDVFLETALVDVRHVQGALRKTQPNMLFGQILYDAGPLLYPEYADEGMHKWFCAQYMSSIRKQDFTFSISRNSALEFAELLPRYDKLTRHQYYVPLPNYVSTHKVTEQNKTELTSRLGISAENHVILSVATLEPRKNLLALIHAFERYMNMFPEQGKNARLVLVGGRGWKNEELLAVLEKYPQQIIVPGYLSELELQTLFECADTLVMVSHYEGYGLPVARARAMGLNVITCVNSSLPEAAQMDASFVDPWNLDAMACALSRASRSSNQNKVTKEHSYNQPRSWKEVFEAYINYTKAVAAEKIDAIRLDCKDISYLPHKTRSVAIDVHNISIHESDIRKTGIQEVVANIFAALPEAQKKLGNKIKLTPIPVVLPKHLRLGFNPTLTPTWNQYRKLCKEFSIDINSFGSTFTNLLCGDSRAIETAISSSEWFVSTSQFCVEKLPHFQRILNSDTKFCYLFYDNIPVKFPECAPQEIINWYRNHYLDSIKKWSSACVAISRHSACDLAESLGDEYQRPIIWQHFPYKSYPLPSGDYSRKLQKLLNYGFKQPKYFVVLGSLDPRKNVSKILSAFVKFTSMLDVEENVSLVLIGASGWKHKLLLSQLEILEQEGRVIRPGYLSDEEMAVVLKHSKGLLMPSRYEGFGLPIAAACRFGIPVMTCVNSSLPEVGFRGDSLFVDPNRVDEMAMALLRMFRSSEKTQRKFEKAHYEWADYVCELAENLLSIGNQNG